MRTRTVPKLDRQHELHDDHITVHPFPAQEPSDSDSQMWLGRAYKAAPERDPHNEGARKALRELS